MFGQPNNALSTHGAARVPERLLVPLGQRYQSNRETEDPLIYNDSHKGLDDLAETVERTAKALLEHKDRFDFIAVRGCSGMLVGAPVSLKIGKPLVVVRKDNEDSHSWSRKLVNAHHAEGRYIFLDDFISSGATEKAVRDALGQENDYGSTAEYVGSYEYCRSDKWDGTNYVYAGKWSWAGAKATSDFDTDWLATTA